jgi:hypothetical protein
MKKQLALLVLFVFFAGCGDSGIKNTDREETDDNLFEEVDDSADEYDAEGENDEDITEVFQFDIQRIYDDTAWLAHADRTGRQPGTQGNIDSVEYVRALFEELGLKGAGDDGTYFQSFSFDQWVIKGTPEAGIDDEELPASTGFQVMQYSGSGDVSAEVIFAGHGITVPPFKKSEYPDCPLPETGYDDFAGIDVTGKIALVIRRGPGNLESVHNSCPANDACTATPCLWNFGYKSKNAAIHGAVGVIVVNHYQEAGAIPAGMTLGADYFVEDLPVIFADRDMIETAIPDIKSWSESIDADLAPHSVSTGVNALIKVDAGTESVSADNVVGVLPGSAPELAEEVIVIGAHVDHLGTDPVSGGIYYGADDNASGTAVMMELARAFVLGGHKTARTVVFAAWNAEELGLIGSCKHVEIPAFPISKTVAAWSIDMVGAGDGSGLAVYGATLSSNSWLFDVMTGYADEQELGFEVSRTQPLDASDHVCFYYAGVPAVLLSTLGTHAYYHTIQDSIETINKNDLEAAVWLSWSGIFPIAMGIEDNYTEFAP